MTSDGLSKSILDFIAQLNLEGIEPTMPSNFGQIQALPAHAGGGHDCQQTLHDLAHMQEKSNKDVRHYLRRIRSCPECLRQLRSFKTILDQELG